MHRPLAILCYHRVLPDEERHAAGRPYFVRGTAVSERNFDAQIRSLAERLDVLTESDALAWLDGARDLRRPSCWITFDDGYRDVIDRAAPILAAHGLPATAFVTSGVIEEEGQWLPADHWYATLTRATRSRGALQMDAQSTWEFDLGRDYGRFVDGPEKRRYLSASPREREKLRRRLAEALGAAEPPPADLYLTRDALRRLAEAGWSIGGHGRTHALLSSVENADLIDEVTGPARFLQALGLSARAFAYPDGAFTPEAAEATQRAGWTSAVILGNRAASPLDGRFLLPRFLPSDHADWVEGKLLPAVAG